MSPVTRAYLFQGLRAHKTAKDVLEPIARRLETGQNADTVDRLFDSKHANDLRLIAAVSFIVIVWFTVISVLIGMGTGISDFDAVANRPPTLSARMLHSILAGVEETLKLFGPAVAVFGAILAWAYQTGSARLGIVDLFACEIDTLCRTATVVDMVNHQIAHYRSPTPTAAVSEGNPSLANSQFQSQENYFPVFESNSKDLQSLEARVVINITAFYTFMKAVRDSLRKLSDIRQTFVESPPTLPGPKLDNWHESARNVIYMLFLGLESARKAMEDLVEYEPEQAERKMVILISELPAYCFLCGEFTDPQDMRHDRLMLRGANYRKEVPKLWALVDSACNKAVLKVAESTSPPKDGEESEEGEELRLWLQALKLVPELKRRYDEVTKYLDN